MCKSPDVVAVIDDDAFMLQALKALLSANGYATELYESAEAFLAAASACKAICLVVDIQIGSACGIELKRRLSCAGFKFPVIFMTGSDDKAIHKRAIEAGCVAFLQKPFPARQLVEALAKSRG